MASIKRHNVVVARPDGAVEVHRMEEWVRMNPQHLPPGIDPAASTSHQLRSALKRQSWVIDELATEVRLIMPGPEASESTIESVLGGRGDLDEATDESASFALEAQLRDFHC